MQLLDGLRALGPKQVIITDGGNGSAAVAADQHWYLPILPDIKRVETTGAGDAFASATTAGLMRGKTLPEAMRWGQCQAASVIQKIGAEAGLLTAPALDGALATHPELQALPLQPTQ